MSLTSSYYNLYTHITRADGLPVGSGLCIDGMHIVTCAHVVNAVLNRPVNATESPEGEIYVSFPQNLDIPNERFTAKIIAWGWDDDSIKQLNAHQYDHVSVLIKHDFAVLAISFIDEVAYPLLKKESRNLKFIKGDLTHQTFEALSFNPQQPGLINHINGKFGIEDRKYGTTILNPTINPKNHFFDFGSSGSPVLVEMDVGSNSQIVGVAGYVNYLNVNHQAASKDARLINVRNLERLLAWHVPMIKISTIDSDSKKITIQKLELTQRIIKERIGVGQEILCDRMDQVRAINSIKANGTIENIYLIHGNERQKLDAFVDRYRYEFIASKGKYSQLHFLKLPKEKDKDLFCSVLINNFYKAFNFSCLNNVNLETHTIKDVIDNLALIDDIDYVIDCKIENDCVDPAQKKMYAWFFGHFLKPLKEEHNFLSHIHVFVSFYYRPGEDYFTNKEIVVSSFPFNNLPQFENITWPIIEDWLDLVEGKDLERKNSIKRLYPSKPDYDMKEIIDTYKNLVHQLDKF